MLNFNPTLKEIFALTPLNRFITALGLTMALPLLWFLASPQAWPPWLKASGLAVLPSQYCWLFVGGLACVTPFFWLLTGVGIAAAYRQKRMRERLWTNFENAMKGARGIT